MRTATGGVRATPPAKSGGGPRRLRVTVAPGLADVLDALAMLGRQWPEQAAASLVLAALANARRDPIVLGHDALPPPWRRACGRGSTGMSRNRSADTERRVAVVGAGPDRTVRPIVFVVMVAALTVGLGCLHLVLGAPWPWQVALHPVRGGTVVPSG